MKTFKNHQRPRRKYRFDIVVLKKALKSGETVPLIIIIPPDSAPKPAVNGLKILA
jgi:hypothetical protein